MKLTRILSVSFAIVLQCLPLARVASGVLPPAQSALAIVWRWAVGALAALGSFHAVSGASAVITGMVKYVGNTPVGGPTNNAVEPVNQPFKYRITVANAGSDFKKDFYNCIPVPPGLTINTNLGGNGYITGTPTTPGVYPVTLLAGHGKEVITLPATITITSPAVPPQITTPPQSQTVTAGADAVFTVVATGTAPLAYQWRQDGAEIAGATNATLTLTGVTPDQAGAYTVTVSNEAGSVTSAPAVLDVTVPPAISTQPLSQSVKEGANVSFHVVATGTAPLHYQWQKNGVDLAGATSASLQLANVRVTDAGDYTVLVSNVAGAVTSDVATLSVQQAFEPKLQFGTARVANGQFQCSVTGPNDASYVIWVSTDLRLWTPVQTNRVADGVLQFTAPADAPGRGAFYRATIAP
jgi:hypothetical protein